MKGHEDITLEGKKDLDVRMALRLLRFVLPHKVLLVAAFIGMCGMTVCSVAQPYIIKLAVDNNLVKGAFDGFPAYVVVFAIAIIGVASFSYIQMVFVSILGQRVILDLRKRVFSKITSLRMEYFDSVPSGVINTRLTSDIEAVNEMISSGLVSVMGDLILLTSIAAILLLMDKILFSYTLLSIVILLLFVRAIKKHLREANRDMRKNTASINAFLKEYLSALNVIKSFTRETRVQKKFNERNERFKRDAVKLSTLYSLYFPGVEFISALSVAIILFRGGKGVLEGSLSLGTVIAFIAYMEKFFGPVRDMSDKYNILQSALASCERIFSVLDMESSPEYSRLNDFSDKMGMGKEGIYRGPAIEVSGLTFSYGDETILKDFSFTVNQGESVAIVGATGAGKSTIASVLLRLYEPSKGSIRLMGKDIKSMDVGELRRKIILVPQEPFLFDGTVGENILAGEMYDKERMFDTIECCGIKGFIDNLEKGLETQVGERGERLSTGQRQLVSFARALYRRPSVLILDEATASVDSEMEQLVLASLAKVMHQSTSIVIAHRLSSVAECDRIIVLSKGFVTEEGNHGKLIKSGGIYSKLYNLQINS